MRINFYGLSHPVYGIWLWRPEQTNPGGALGSLPLSPQVLSTTVSPALYTPGPDSKDYTHGAPLFSSFQLGFAIGRPWTKEGEVSPAPDEPPWVTD